MADSPAKPVVFLAFANDRMTGSEGYLRNLPEEARQLRVCLEQAEHAGLCELVLRPNSTLDEILDVFQSPRYRNRIALFHYGGHANGYQLLLETAAGKTTTAYAGGLAALLGAQAQQGELQLVFLNGCSTEPQMQGLIDAGVPAVIATSQAIDDAVATEFAARFYQALAGGAALRSAFVQTEGAVKAAHGSTPRHLFPPDTLPALAERWPWMLSARPGAEAVEQWSLPVAAGDLLFGLPSLPPRDLPASPYRYLDWYRQEDAELFFGRGRAIRDLYTRLTAADSPPLLLLYGQSGVGKSSLLAAGLLPRLELTHTVAYLRREQSKGLLGTLTSPPSPLCASELGLGWRAVEQQMEKPLVVILDQVEEVFTRPNLDLPDELGQCLAALQGVFGDPAQRPQGKLLLSFRKEWLAELEKLLAQYALPRAKLFLERLDRAGIVEVVTGPARVTRLQQHYGLGMEEGLADEIAGELLADPASPVATTLQILLAKLWEKATARSPSRPYFDTTLYHEVRRGGIALDAFLDQQLVALRQTHAHAAESGLEIDLLAFHTTAKGTAEQRSPEELAQAYPHYPDLPELVQQNRELYLLTDAGGEGSTEGITRLAHDTLAPLVRMRYEVSDAPGQRARRILENRAVEWQGGKEGTLLDEADLALVEAGEHGMRAWNEDETRLVEASRQASQRRGLHERNRRRLTTLVVALFLLAGAAALWLGQASQAARAREQTALHAQATEAALRATAEVLSAEEAVARQTAQTNEALAATREAEARAAEDRALAAQAETEMLKDVVETNRLVAEAEVASNYGLPQRRLLLALEAVDVHRRHGQEPRAAAQTALRAALGSSGGIGLSGHTDAITTLAFSPDGRWLATGSGEHVPDVGSKDSTARLWDVQDPGVAPVILAGHTDGVSTLAFSPDGRWLATGSWDKTVRLWDMLDSGSDSIVLAGYEQAIRALAFSPDSRWLATGSGDSTVRLWDVQDPGAEPVVLNGHTASVDAVAFSPDGRWLASGSGDHTARMWDMQDMTAEPLVLAGHEGAIAELAFSPDGAWLATASDDQTARLWDVQNPAAEPVVLAGHEDSIWSMAFSPDGAWLATGSEDTTTRLWNMQEPAADPVVLPGYAGGVQALGFSPDGAWLVTTASWDSAALLWDMTAPGTDPIVLRNHENAVTAVAFSLDNRWLATGSSDGTARLWDVYTPIADPVVLAGHTDAIDVLAFSPNGRWLVSGSQETAARLWDMQDLRVEPALLAAPEGAVTALAFSPGANQLVMSSQDGTVRLWELSDVVHDPIVLGSRVEGTDFLDLSPDGRWLALGSSGAENLWLWDMHEPATDPMMLGDHAGGVQALAFTPDGRWLATAASWDTTARLWDLQNPATDPVVLRGHYGGIWTLAFSPDGRWLATGSDDATARLWDLHDLSADPVVLTGYTGGITALAFSPNGRWLATGSLDAAVWLWDIQALDRAPTVFSGHTYAITVLAFSPDGRWLATGSDDATARLWDIQSLSAESVVLNAHQSSIYALAFSPDGRWLATGSADNTVRLWRVSLTELVELACRTAGRNLTQAELDRYFPDAPEQHRQTCPNLPLHPSVAPISS